MSDGDHIVAGLLQSETFEFGVKCGFGDGEVRFYFYGDPRDPVVSSVIFYPLLLVLQVFLGHITKVFHLGRKASMFQVSENGAPAALVPVLTGAAVLQVLLATADLLGQGWDEHIPRFLKTPLPQVITIPRIFHKTAERYAPVRIDMKLPPSLDASCEKTIILQRGIMTHSRIFG